jgi:hypothetical protein
MPFGPETFVGENVRTLPAADGYLVILLGRNGTGEHEFEGNTLRSIAPGFKRVDPHVMNAGNAVHGSSVCFVMLCWRQAGVF